MKRLIQLALLLAVIIPFGWAVSVGVKGLGQRGLDFGSGVVIGMIVCYAFWLWDDRVRQRGDESRRD